MRTQFERELRDAIRTGRLRPGTLLPSSRSLAADLGLSRGVVVEAYEQLHAEGYLAARHGSATRVAARESNVEPAAPVEPAPPPMRYDFRPGVPDAGMFPRRTWLLSLRRVLTSAPGTAFGYPDPSGAAPLRRALAAYLNRVRGTAARADRVVLCTGFAQGLRLVCQALRARGVARVVVEDPSHAVHRATMQALGLTVLPIPVDRGGLCAEHLRSIDAGAVFVTPAHQFPTGAVLAPERRTALLDWAAARQAVVIEDDYDAEYRYDREPIGALQGLVPERVAYAGSVSKTLAPALRLGWLVLPADLVAEVTRIKRREDLGSPALDQLAYADFLDRGELDRHLRRTRLHYRRRRDILVAALRRHAPGLRLHGVAAGLHLLVELDPAMDERRVSQAAAKLSVGVYGVRAHRARHPGPPALLLGYGNLSNAAIVEGVKRLGSVLAPQSASAC
ncbi:MAG TPA: PLP-dependent aminotransferase family protein [Methylomirabilota bacterium]|nr:PLP-dependent aminotransferase family protein [Methylomirabilota bacterium]